MNYASPLERLDYYTMSSYPFNAELFTLMARRDAFLNGASVPFSLPVRLFSGYCKNFVYFYIISIDIIEIKGTFTQ